MAQVSTVPAVAAEPAPSSYSGPSALSVGTVVWLASELMFFAGLFAAWFALRSENEVWPPEGVELDVLRTGVATAVLVASSFTMHAGNKAADAGDKRRAARWVVVTAVMGTLFLANQFVEYLELDFRMESHAYGSIFFLLTGFHGFHVLAGVLGMLVILAVGTGRTRASLPESLTVTSYYWHFVDVVWVAMFLTIYVIG